MPLEIGCAADDSQQGAVGIEKNERELKSEMRPPSLPTIALQ